MSKRERISERTYRLFSLVTFRSVDGIMIFGNVEVEEMLVWKVLLALRTSVHVGLLVVDIVGVERVE